MRTVNRGQTTVLLLMLFDFTSTLPLGAQGKNAHVITNRERQHGFRANMP